MLCYYIMVDFWVVMGYNYKQQVVVEVGNTSGKRSDVQYIGGLTTFLMRVCTVDFVGS
jgi:hypothetical protein